ncbi:iron chelate uptake ABC transporter family permease subunit [Erwinia sp. CPCC 100877]|nr:iron chelate uptake ABC transporter family permease subunit [Erwinia sp. CPCC 100877]
MKNMKRIVWWLFLLALPLITGLICLGMGRYSLSLTESFHVLLKHFFHLGEGVSRQAVTVVVNMRLPRVLIAMLCGAGLAIAGICLQSIFANPLVSPDTIGVASGASFGAAIALAVGVNLWLVQWSALLFGLAALALTYFVSTTKGERTTIMLVLSGLVISSLFQAGVSLIKYVVDTEERLPAITYWLMGSLSNTTYRSLLVCFPFIIVSMIVVYLLRWKTNLLMLSEDEARSLGINVARLRLLLILASTFITAAVVSVCGQIGWVGLLIPHVSRMLFGNNNQKAIPAAISLGATFLVVIDTMARTLISSEIPISILTAVIGAPCFIFLLKRTGGNW